MRASRGMLQARVPPRENDLLRVREMQMMVLLARPPTPLRPRTFTFSQENGKPKHQAHRAHPTCAPTIHRRERKCSIALPYHPLLLLAKVESDKKVVRPRNHAPRNEENEQQQEGDRRARGLRTSSEGTPGAGTWRAVCMGVIRVLSCCAVLRHQEHNASPNVFTDIGCVVDR